MSADDYVILEWSYTPANFFEEAVYVRRDDYEIRIEDGKATATVDPNAYDAEHKKRDELHEVVDGLFKSELVMLDTPRPYELSRASVARVLPDGRRDKTVFLEGATMVAVAGNIDVSGALEITLASGEKKSVPFDTKQARLDEKRKWRDRCERLLPCHPVLRKLLDSYREAVGDPDKELVRLYEIWDALKSRFGARQAEAVLKLEKGRGGRLEKLANDRTVRQGRHSGQHLGESRDATAEELREAWEIARGLIEAYVRWAEKMVGGKDE